MRFILLVLASIISIALGQQSSSANFTYSDCLALFANQTSLTGLWIAVQKYIEIADQFAHFANVTIIAPNNDAIIAFTNEHGEFASDSNRTTLEAVMKYHIIQGLYPDINDLTFQHTFLAPTAFTNVTGGQTVGIAKRNGNMTFLGGKGRQAVSVSDTLYYQGGIVHIIDQVMTIPVNVVSTASYLNLTALSGTMNLTGLGSSLGATSDVTIFAPLNSGFAAIASQAARMTVSDVQQLMKYHIIAGDVVHSTQFNNTQLATTNGKNVTMTVHADGSSYVNNARVVLSDILLSNGVLHIIDNVLNPDNATVLPTDTSTGVVAFADATANGSTPFTNVPIANQGPSLNSTTLNPDSGANNSPSKSKLSAGAIAGITIGVVILLAIIATAIILYMRLKGYRVKMSRKSIVISAPRMIVEEHYELPPEGGVSDKVELPGCVPPAYGRKSKPSHALSDSSASKSDTTALLEEKPPTPPAKDDVIKKKESPISPMSSQSTNVFELSAESDLRGRIERLLRPKDS